MKYSNPKIHLTLFCFLITIVFGCLGIITASYIFANDNIPTISIDNSGENLTEAIFTESSGPWYPGYSETRILRVRNTINSKTNINNLGMNISLFKEGEKLSSDSNSVDYMNHMKIKIDYKSPIKKFLNGNVYNGNFANFKEGIDSSIKLDKNDYIDLVYTISMSEDAEINIAGIKAKVDFVVNVSEEVYSKNENNDEIKSRSHWAHDCIKTLLDKEIIQGYPDGTIKPDNYITRAEAAVLVSKALELEEENNLFTGYIDFQPRWAKGYIISTTKEGIFKGYPGRLFRPHKYISREEMTAILIRGFKKKVEDSASIQFEDDEEISDWAKEYINSAVKNKIIEGYPDKTFRPQDNITRAESFTIICKLLGYHKEHNK